MLTYFISVTVNIHFSHSKECRSKMPSNMRSFMQPIAVRVLTIMLLTDPSWGYDVAVYDPDAFVLQDPTEMYSSVVEGWGADVVAQKARFPPSLSAVWGFTLCMGAAYYRSGPRLSELALTPTLLVGGICKYAYNAYVHTYCILC